MIKNSSTIYRLECHCNFSEMQADGESVYRCPDCGWRVRLSVDAPLEGWYEFQDVDHPELLPICLTCGERMSLVGAGWVPDDEHPYRCVHFWCTNSKAHPATLAMDAYLKEISREELMLLEARLPAGLARFFLHCLGAEDKASLESLATNVDLTGQRPWVLELASLPAALRSGILNQVVYFEKGGAISEAIWDENTISFRIGPQIVAAIAEKVPQGSHSS